jgi:hypothetical protein
MKLPLQSLCDGIDEVKVTVTGSPSGGHEVNAPASVAAPEEVKIPAQERCAFLKVIAQGIGFESLGRLAIRLQHPPPGNGIPMMTHHGPHLPGAAGAKKLGDVAVCHNSARRDEVNQGKHRLDILPTHGSRLAVLLIPAGSRLPPGVAAFRERPFGNPSARQGRRTKLSAVPGSFEA